MVVSNHHGLLPSTALPMPSIPAASMPLGLCQPIAIGPTFGQSHDRLEGMLQQYDMPHFQEWPDMVAINCQGHPDSLSALNASW